MKFDKQTIEFYNENAQKYSSYSYEHEKGDLYQKFLNNLPKQGSILDAGCGAGWDTKFFLSNGYFVTAFDASIKLLEAVETHKNLEKIEKNKINVVENELPQPEQKNNLKINDILNCLTSIFFDLR